MLPFHGDTPGAIFDSILHKMPAAGVRLNRDLPTKLEDIINKALEKDRDLRFQSAAEMRADLQRLKHDTQSVWKPVAPEGPVSTASQDVVPSKQSTERHRPATAPSLSAAAVAPTSSSSWKIAIPALIGLAVLVVLGFYWRSHRTKTLTEKDTVVLADFANSTGDPVFDGTLRQGLSAQLEQSPFLNLLSDERIAQTLSLMAQPKGVRLTHELGREVCQRTGSTAVLNGSIAQVGTQYLLTMKAVKCGNGESLASTEAQASDKNHVLEALGKMASEIRSKLGESLASLQSYDAPLESVTTKSLEALKSYSLGSEEALVKEDWVAAIALFERAISLDPNFAMAYAGMELVTQIWARVRVQQKLHVKRMNSGNG